MADLNKMAEELVNLTVKEVNELATILKDEHGIEPAAAAVAVAAGPGAGGDAGGGEEKSEFDVILTAAGSAKLAVVKAVKELTGFFKLLFERFGFVLRNSFLYRTWSLVNDFLRLLQAETGEFFYCLHNS